MYVLMLAFMGVGDPNLGLPACPAGTFPTEPSPRFHFCFEDKLSCIPGWPWTHYIAKDDFLSVPPQVLEL